MTTKDEALKLALEALDEAIKMWREEMEYRSCIDAADSWEKTSTAIKQALAAPVQEPVAWPTLIADEREALERFHETWEDDQGYDVPKPMMKRLAKLGVVYSEGFGRYGMTNFGLAALQSTPPAAPVQEPVAWRVRVPGYADNYYNAGTPSDKDIAYWRDQGVELELAYGTPPAAQRQWVGLTDEEITKEIKAYWGEMIGAPLNAHRVYVRAIEAKLREKNEAQPALKPLTDEEIEQCCYEADSKADDHTMTFKWTVAFARAIEAAYGITEKGNAA